MKSLTCEHTKFRFSLVAFQTNITYIFFSSLLWIAVSRKLGNLRTHIFYLGCLSSLINGSLECLAIDIPDYLQLVESLLHFHNEEQMIRNTFLSIFERKKNSQTLNRPFLCVRDLPSKLQHFKTLSIPISVKFQD